MATGDYTETKFYRGLPAATAATTCYTVAASKLAIIKNVVLCNVSATAAFTVTVSWGSQLAIDTVTLQKTESLSLAYFQVLTAGSTITAQQGTANKVVVHICGLLKEL